MNPSRIMATFVCLLITAPSIAQYADNTPALGRVRPPGLVHILDIELSPPLAYVVGTGGLWVIDITDSNQPKLLSSYRPSGAGRGGAQIYGAAVKGNILYCFERSNGMEVIDVSNPGSPIPVGSPYRRASGFAYESGVILGSHLYIAAHDNGVEILDIRNPRQPVATGLVSTANAFALAQQDSFLFVADGAAGLTVIDLHAQATPKVIANRPTTALAQDVVVYQNHAYVAVGSSGMDVFDLADPAAPKFVTNYHVDGFTNHLNISGQRAYLANWETVEIVDISDPNSPQLVATQHALQRAMTVAVQDRIFYVGDWSTLRIYRYDDFPVPDINTDPLELSFGTVPVGQQQVLDLRIENLGLEPLQVKSISVTGAGFSVSSASFTLNRFESRTIPVTYAPLSQNRVSGFISIQSDDPDESQKIVPLIGGERTIGVGDTPADFTLQDTDGQTYHLQDFIQKKNVIVLAFYASW